MNCSQCQQPIPEERLAALPGTTTCVHCSDVEPYTEEDSTIIDGEELYERTNNA